MIRRAAASEHNLALVEVIASRVREAGSIGFDEFMRLALYHPEHGYYVACDPAFDYQTSPQVHPVFGTMVARQLSALWVSMDRPARFDVFEAGAGAGGLAVDVLMALREEEPALFEACRYAMQDVSMRDTAGRIEGAGVLDKAAFADELPGDASIEGCVLSNELLDALPFRRVRVERGVLHEVNVALEDERFVDRPVPASTEVRAYFDALGLLPGEGCDAEVNLEAVEWMHRAAASLRRGYVVTLDYGYAASELYAPGRKRGTMLTFYRHMEGDDPYQRVGRQDITASVDFTSLRKAGAAAGLRTAYEAAQAEWLVAMGLREVVAQAGRNTDREALYALRRAAAALTDEAGLGRVRVLIQAKDGVGD